MLNNLFYIFDPFISSTPINFMIIMVMYLIMMNNSLWMNKMKTINIFYSINSLINNNSMKTSSIHILLFIIFILMIMNNLMNMFPMNFYLTSNYMFNFSISLSLMMMMNLMTFINNNKVFFMNLVPLNSPMPLMNMNIIIESISLMIRFLTLSMRLMINMMIGHIMMNFMNKILPIFLMFEIMMMMIQSYVFFLLNLMYLNETY